MVIPPRHKSRYFSTFPILETILVLGLIAMLTVLIVMTADNYFNHDKMLILRPVLCSISVFIAFTFILWNKFRDELIGEIGFIYLLLALAYTISPAIKFLILDFDLPTGFDGMNFAVLSPQPNEMGEHFWRHFLLISGVAAGYLIFRGRRRYSRVSLCRALSPRYGFAIFVLLFIIACCIGVVTILLPQASTYIGHYTRFNELSLPERLLVYVCLIFKSGGYFVLLSLLFREYDKYKYLIYLMVPIICAYEVIFSLGSRIAALTILMAVLGFYHFKAHPITVKKGALLLMVLAVLFSLIGQIRHYGYNFQEIQYNIVDQQNIIASELEAVYCTSFHLYYERKTGSLPPSDILMFINDLIMVIPFIEHTKYNPQYWYARHYFPEREVPPTTMGILANSAIWGGEWDLLIRSLVNGAFFALIYRWFLRREEKWWALSIYIFSFSYCIMALKYSVFYIFTPLFRILMPSLLLTGLIIGLIKIMSQIPVRYFKHNVRINNKGGAK